MATRVMATPMAFPSTDENVSVKACCASSTSLFSRLTRAPVWVLVKKAMGMRWKCAKTCVRMSKMRPSPTLAEIHRCHRDRITSDSARTASRRASWTTAPELWGRMPSSMMAR